MTTEREQQIARILSHLFWEHMVDPYPTPFESAEQANRFLVSLISNRGIQWERSLIFPDEILMRSGHNEILDCCLSLGVDGLIDVISAKPALHRWITPLSEAVYLAMRTVQDTHEGDVRNLWNDRPEGKETQRRLRSFKGIGDKISALGTRQLALTFGVELADGLSSIDVSPDVHVMRVFRRLKLIDDDDPQSVIATAQKLSKESVTMDGAWVVGMWWCHASSPSCGTCPLWLYC